VLLNLEDSPEEGLDGVLAGTTHLLFLLANRDEFPRALAEVIVDVSKEEGDNRYDCAMGSDVGEMIDYFLSSRFARTRYLHSSTIGSTHSNNVQSFLYDLSAAVMSKYIYIDSAGPSRINPKKSDALRRATRLVAHVCGGLKNLLPPFPTMYTSWTDWHALSYVLEMTNGTILEVGNTAVVRGNFLLFFDEVIKNVLQERKNNTITSLGDLKSSFGWCAASENIRFLTSLVCESEELSKIAPNVVRFKEAIVFSLDASERLSCPQTPLREDPPSEPGPKRIRLV
jgi:hypothetical protein